jgi:hypothetical protein
VSWREKILVGICYCATQGVVLKLVQAKGALFFIGGNIGLPRASLQEDPKFTFKNRMTER